MDPPPRKFAIVDGMILVAAVACGFALLRMADETGVLEPHGWNFNWLGRNVVRPTGVAITFLIGLTPAVLIVRLRRPRPRWRRLIRQPGMAACCAAMVPIALAMIQFTCLTWGRNLRGESPFDLTLPSGLPGGTVVRSPLGESPFDMTMTTLQGMFREFSFDAGVWVLAAWLALALSGRRQGERGGIDRLGRLVGLGWLLILAVHVLGAL